MTSSRQSITVSLTLGGAVGLIEQVHSGRRRLDAEIAGQALLGALAIEREIRAGGHNLEGLRAAPAPAPVDGETPLSYYVADGIRAMLPSWARGAPGYAGDQATFRVYTPAGAFDLVVSPAES